MTDLWRLGAVGVASAVRAGQLSAMAVCEAALARISDRDQAIGAFCRVEPEAARAAAWAVDRAVEQGIDPGPLAGVPVAVKDLLSTVDLPTTFSSWHYASHRPLEDDVSVARLRAAGAVIIGKTVSSEFGYSALGANELFPAPGNPHDPSLTTGGSSAGSGAAVAYGAAPLALGSDGGGSIRIPAALCGVVGFKPSMGRVPVWPGCKDDRLPGISSWDSLEHVGPLARTVADIDLAMQVLSGPDPRDRFSLPGNPFGEPLDRDWLVGRTVGISFDYGYIDVDREVRGRLAEVAGWLEAEFSCVVVERDPDLGDISEPFYALIAAETDLDGMRVLADQHPFAPYTTELLERAWTAEDFSRARTMRQRVCRVLADYMADVDLMITPTSPVPPFPLSGVEPGTDPASIVPAHWLALCNPLNLTGQPAISLPAGTTGDGRPIGIQLVGRHLADADLLAAAHDLEPILPNTPWPAEEPGPSGR